MKISKVCDLDLISTTKKLVQEERAKTLEVLEHIAEIYRRRLHLFLGYQSLHEFLVCELSYSDGAAHRRIFAMKLCEDVPEARASIASGSLSLSTAARAQGFFKAEKEKNKKTYAPAEKIDLLSKLEGASRDKCEQVFAEFSPTYAARPRELRIEDDEELRVLMEEYRQLAMLADGSPASVIKAALRAGVDTLRKKTVGQSGKQVGSFAEKLTHSIPKRYIPAQTRRLVWIRDAGRCSYINPRTQLRCEARHALEYDHVRPFALGGMTTSENLRLLCRAHNQARVPTQLRREAPEFKRNQG